MTLISVCIPTYEMSGKGAFFLRESLDIMVNQTFKDFDIVVSDHSQDSCIQNLCAEYKGLLDIKYYKNTEGLGNSSANINNAIKNATGRLIKILFQDDFFTSNNSLKEIANNFDLNKDKWLISACLHTKDGKRLFRPFYPKYNRFIYLGINTISSPSVLTIINDEPLLFDQNLIWLMDCDYYHRCYSKFGPPKIIKIVNIVNRIGLHQVSKKMVKIMTRIKEWKYIIHKYDNN